MELVDTLHSGCSILKDVQVRVLFWVHSFSLSLAKILLVVGIICISRNLFAQQIVIHDTTFQYAYLISKSTTTNPFLTQFLSQFSKKTGISDPYFKLSIRANLNTSQVNTSQYQIHCSIIKDSIQGNTNYWGFDIGKQLFPSNIELTVSTKMNNKLQQYPLQGFIQGQNAILGRLFIEDTLLLKSPPFISDITLNFDQQWIDEVLLQMKAIETYKSADSLFTHWDSTLNLINIEKTELLPLLDFELDGLILEITDFNNLNIINRLNLSQSNPHQFGSKITSINIKAGQKQVILNESLMNIDQRFILDARKYKEKGNILLAINSYNKALEYHRYNIVAMNELAKLYYEIGNLEACAILVKQLFTTTYPDESQYSKCIETGNILYKKIVNQGNDMLVAQNYSQAIKIYQIGSLFCDSIQEPICDGSHLLGIKNAKNGIYLSYINVIEKAVQKNLVVIAQNYATEAHHYQQLNKNEIPDDSKLQNLVDIIISKQLFLSNKYIQHAQFLDALTSLESADSIGRQFRSDFSLPILNSYRSKAANGGLIQITNEIETAVKSNDPYIAQKWVNQATDFKNKYQNYITDSTSLIDANKHFKSLDYQNLIAIGNQLYRLDFFQNALSKYSEAKELQLKYKIPPLSNLDSIISAMSKPLILDYLSIARQSIWGNNFSAATVNMAKADTLVRANFMANDTSITQIVMSTKELFYKQQCLYLQNNYQNYFTIYQTFFKQKRYSESLQYLDSMNLIYASKNSCNIENKLTEKELNFVKIASQYQQKIQDARYLISIHKTDEALSSYFSANALYTANNIDSNYLVHELITSILIFAPTNETYFEVCNWLYQSILYSEALPVIQLMSQKGIDQKQTRKWKKIFNSAIAKNKKKTDSPSK